LTKDLNTSLLAERSPTALALADRSFNADSENICGISLAMHNAVKLFYETEESREGVRAFKDRRKPDFHKYGK
jgi:2-ketocyclohexanecarboxyl-CoA hydrolase